MHSTYETSLIHGTCVIVVFIYNIHDTSHILVFMHSTYETSLIHGTCVKSHTYDDSHIIVFEYMVHVI